MFETKFILITGAPGWLGTRVVRSLVNGLEKSHGLPSAESNIEIRCLVLPGTNVDVLREISDRVVIVEGDLQNSKSLNPLFENTQNAVLFHGAGVIHPRNVKEFTNINVNGTKNLLNLAVQYRVQKSIVVSSNSPCGCNPHPDHLFDEYTPYHPYMGYGHSKMLVEQFANNLHQKGDLNTVIIRLPWFYGPDQPPRQTLFFQMIQDGKMPIVGDGNNLRSMVYVDNICQGLIRAAITPQAIGQTYWIADETPYSMNQIVDTIEKLLESEFQKKCLHKRMRLPWLASEVAGGLDYIIQALGLYHQKIHVLSEMNKTIACSIKNAMEQLGYKPVINLEEGMRRSIQWCIENKYL